jgi:distribution and morphology protein 12
MALPVRLTIVGFEFNGEVVVAYQPSRKRVHICVLDDEDPYRPATTSSSERVPHHRPNEKEKVSAGSRLLPHIFIESEIGQADKQVLRNVSRVEKFLQDMMRLTLEQELVFPNYQTIIYGEEE